MLLMKISLLHDDITDPQQNSSLRQGLWLETLSLPIVFPCHYN